MGLLLPDAGRILVDGEPLLANRILAWRCAVWESLSQRQAGRFQTLLKAATERTEV